MDQCSPELFDTNRLREMKDIHVSSSMLNWWHSEQWEKYTFFNLLCVWFVLWKAVEDSPFLGFLRAMTKNSGQALCMELYPGNASQVSDSNVSQWVAVNKESEPELAILNDLFILPTISLRREIRRFIRLIPSLFSFWNIPQFYTNIKGLSKRGEKRAEVQEGEWTSRYHGKNEERLCEQGGFWRLHNRKSSHIEETNRGDPFTWHCIQSCKGTMSVVEGTQSVALCTTAAEAVGSACHSQLHQILTSHHSTPFHLW